MRTVCILGDLTDAKDYHPSALTNRLVSEIMRLRSVTDEVIILQGNHDYLRAGHAYFEFMNHLPGVRFIVKPTEVSMDDGPTAFFLPHTKTPRLDWVGMDFSHYAYTFMHQTAPGSIASNGQKMDGDDLPSFEATKAYSGDIHVPQIIGDIEYVGSPYPVHFGDTFKARCILLDRRARPVDLFMESPARTTVTVSSIAELKKAGLKMGDQVKLRINLSAAEKHEWSRIRREAFDHLKTIGAEVHGIDLRVGATSAALLAFSKALGAVPGKVSDATTVERFVANEDLGGDVLDVGLGLIE